MAANCKVVLCSLAIAAAQSLRRPKSKRPELNRPEDEMHSDKGTLVQMLSGAKCETKSGWGLKGGVGVQLRRSIMVGGS